MEPLSGDVVDDVVDVLAFVEPVEETGECTEVQRGGADAQQVVLDPTEFGQNGANDLAAGREIDIEELLGRMVPGDVVDDRADVVHPADRADVLVVVVMLTELLESAVEVPDVGRGSNHPFAIELEHDPDGRVGGGVLGSEVQDPPITSRGPRLQVIESIDVDIPGFGGLELKRHAGFLAEFVKHFTNSRPIIPIPTSSAPIKGG